MRPRTQSFQRPRRRAKAAAGLIALLSVAVLAGLGRCAGSARNLGGAGSSGHLGRAGSARNLGRAGGAGGSGNLGCAGHPAAGSISSRWSETHADVLSLCEEAGNRLRTPQSGSGNAYDDRPSLFTESRTVQRNRS